MVQHNRSRSNIREQAVRSAGEPVVVTLTDGRQYVGRVERISGGQLYLSGVQVRSTTKSRRRPPLKKTPSPTRRRVRTSSFLFPLLQAGTGGAGAAGPLAEQAVLQQGGGFGLNGLKDWMGFMEKALPMIKMGMGVVKSIIPLLSAFKA